MSVKKVILVLAVIFLSLSLFQAYLSFQIPSPPKITTSNTATVSLCFARPPDITTIPDQNATVNQIFTYQVLTKFYGSNTSIFYYDNTSLFNINQSGYISFTPQSSDAGLHTILITVEDSSHCPINVSETFTLNISAVEEEEEEEAPAPPGGGGAAPPPPVKEYKETQKADLKPGPNLIKIKDPKISFRELTLNTLESIPNIRLDISAFPQKPAPLAFLPGTVYQYLKIEKLNLKDTHIKDVEIKFRIKKSWLKKHTPNSQDILLFHYQTNQWKNLPTEFLYTDDTYAYYQSLSPTLSYFAISAKTISFQLSQQTLKSTLKQYQKLEKKITLTNDGATDLKIEITSPFPDLLAITPSTLALPKDQEQEITLILNPNQNATLGIYPGLISFHATHQAFSLTKPLTLILEIESEEVLFDLSLDLPQKTLFPGEELKATLALFNLRRIIPANVTLIYQITDLNNILLYQENETLSLEEQASFTKTFPLPKEIQPGQYLLSIKILYPSSFATATELFNIEKPLPPAIEKPFIPTTIPIMFAIIIFILIILSVLAYFIYKKARKPKIIIKPDIARLKRKLSLLKQSYQKGYIKKETYKKTRSELQKLIKKKTSVKK